MHWLNVTEYTFVCVTNDHVYVPFQYCGVYKHILRCPRSWLRKFNIRNPTDAISGTGTAHPFRTLEFNLIFNVACIAQSLVSRVLLCRLSFETFFPVWPLCYLSSFFFTSPDCPIGIFKLVLKLLKFTITWKWNKSFNLISLKKIYLFFKLHTLKGAERLPLAKLLQTNTRTTYAYSRVYTDKSPCFIGSIKTSCTWILIAYVFFRWKRPKQTFNRIPSIHWHIFFNRTSLCGGDSSIYYTTLITSFTEFLL